MTDFSAKLIYSDDVKAPKSSKWLTTTLVTKDLDLNNNYVCSWVEKIDIKVN